jgi:hypothetical protein
VINGLLILACAVMAWRTAVARDFGAHDALGAATVPGGERRLVLSAWG